MLRFVEVSFVFLCLANESLAQQPPASWAGHRAIATQGKIKLYESIADPTSLKVVGEITESYVTVDREEKGYLYVRSVGQKGWVQKDLFRFMDTAIPYFTERIERNPKDGYAISQRAILWKNKKEYDKAAADYNAAIALDPKSPAHYHNRGLLSASQQLYNDALADYDMALTLRPNYLLAIHHRGNVYHSLKEYDKAIADFGRSIELNPKYATPYVDRGNSYVAKKDDASARADFTKAIELDPKDASPLRFRGLLHARARAFDKASADFEAAIALAPKAAPVRADYAWLLATCPEEKFRDGKKAVAQAKTACDLSNWKVPSQIATLGAAYAEAGDFPSAIRYQKQALEFPEYARTAAQPAQQRLKLYEEGKPFHEK